MILEPRNTIRSSLSFPFTLLSLRFLSGFLLLRSSRTGYETKGAELVEVQRQLESAQQMRSSVCLSERSIVELVQKLQERHVLDFHLLRIVSRKKTSTMIVSESSPLVASLLLSSVEV